MVITYTDEKKFTKEQTQRLFLSVGWVSGQYPERLHKALMGSSTVFSAWDGERLVGLVRVLDDTEMVAYMHYVLVDPEYQGRGIAGHLVGMVKQRYHDYLYIEVMPEESKNATFYEKHGFHIMEDGVAMQICNPGTGIGHVLRTSGGEGRHLSPEAFPLPLIFFGVRLSDLE